jgi:hypothetical protein
MSPALLADGQAHQPLLDGSGLVVDPLFVVDRDVATDRDTLARAAPGRAVVRRVGGLIRPTGASAQRTTTRT